MSLVYTKNLFATPTKWVDLFWSENCDDRHGAQKEFGLAQREIGVVGHMNRKCHNSILVYYV